MLGRPIAERVEELPYLDLQRMDDTLEGHEMRRYWKGHYFRSLPDEAIDAFLLRGTADGHGDAAARRVDSRPTAARSPTCRTPRARSASATRMFECIVGARWTDAAEDDERIAAARRHAASLEPFASGVYVNALSDEGAAGVARAYRPAQARPPAGAQGRRTTPTTSFTSTRTSRPHYARACLVQSSPPDDAGRFGNVTSDSAAQPLRGVWPTDRRTSRIRSVLARVYATGSSCSAASVRFSAP